MKHLKDIELLTPLGRKYREDPEYRERYLNKIKQKKYIVRYVITAYVVLILPDIPEAKKNISKKHQKQ